MDTIYSRKPYMKAEAKILAYINYWRRVSLSLLITGIVGYAALGFATHNVLGGLIFWVLCFILFIFYNTTRVNYGFKKWRSLINKAFEIGTRKNYARTRVG